MFFEEKKSNKRKQQTQCLPALLNASGGEIVVHDPLSHGLLQRGYGEHLYKTGPRMFCRKKNLKLEGCESCVVGSFRKPEEAICRATTQILVWPVPELFDALVAAPQLSSIPGLRRLIWLEYSAGHTWRKKGPPRITQLPFRRLLAWAVTPLKKGLGFRPNGMMASV